MHESETYRFSDDQYAGHYCEDHANQQWAAYAKQVIDNVGDPYSVLRDLEEHRPEHVDLDECANAGEFCETCDEQIAPVYARCEGCGRWGYLDDTFEEPVEFGIEWNPDGDGDPCFPWCDYCRDENGPAPEGQVRLGTDCRGYVMFYQTGYTDEMTYCQFHNSSHHSADTVDWDNCVYYIPGGVNIYRAGCRRFTLADAIMHWCRDYIHRGGRLNCTADSIGAIELLSMVIRHADPIAMPV